MSERDAPPLTPELQGLLAAERRRPGLTPAALEKIAVRVAALGPVAPSSDGWAQRLVAGKGGTVVAAFVAGAVAGGGGVAVVERRARAPMAQEQRGAPAPPAAEAPPPAPRALPAAAPPAPAVLPPPKSTGDRAAIRRAARTAHEDAPVRAPVGERDVALAA